MMYLSRPEDPRPGSKSCVLCKCAVLTANKADFGLGSCRKSCSFRLISLGTNAIGTGWTVQIAEGL